MIRETTPEPSRRQRKRAERTAEILDHAMAIVIADGLAGLTMPRLAREADAAVGALYRYFDSKDAVIAGLQGRAVQRLGAFLARRMEVGDPLQRIVAAAAAWEGFRQEEPASHALVDRSLSEPEAVLTDAEAQAVDQAVGAALEPLVDALGEAEAQGVLHPGDPVVRAHALWAAVHGVGHFRKRDRLLPAALHAAAIGRALLVGLLVGWGADREAARVALEARWP